jgi:translation initiation factor 4E
MRMGHQMMMMIRYIIDMDTAPGHCPIASISLHLSMLLLWLCLSVCMQAAPVQKDAPRSSAPAPAAATAATPASAATSTAATPAAAFSANADAPLETEWTFYFDKKMSREAQAAQQAGSGFTNYAQNLQRVGAFNTVQGFWHHYSYMQAPDSIPKEHNLYMFRGAATPAWETFPQGGCWILKVRKHNGVINRLWEELCFASIGEWWNDPQVCGITLSTRAKDDNISVWCSTPDNASIGEKLKEILNLDESTQVEYKAFKVAVQDGSSFRNAKAFTYAPAAANAAQ